MINQRFNLSKYGPCKEALDWYKTQPDSITAWENCPRGDWMLWIAQRLNVNIHTLTLAKGYCAKTVIHLMKDERSRDAVKVAIKFGTYHATKTDLDISAHAAYAADVAADAAAYAAADAAYAAAAYAAYAAAADAAAYAAADAYATYTAHDAYTAKKKNQLQTANICRKYLTTIIYKKLTNE
jgi:hypothetical protein